MSTVFQFATIQSGSTGAELSAAKNAMYAAENAQPEGTKMELILTLSYPASIVQAFASSAALNAHMASIINTACQDAHVTPWSGTTTIATPLGANQVVLRWTKEAPWILIIIGVLAGLAVIFYAVPGGGYILAAIAALGVGFAIYEWINGWRFEAGKFVNVNTGVSLTPGQFFQTQIPAALGNPMFYIVGGVLLVGGVWLWRKAERETTEVVRDAKSKSRASHIRAKAYAEAKRIRGGG